MCVLSKNQTSLFSLPRSRSRSPSLHYPFGICFSPLSVPVPPAVVIYYLSMIYLCRVLIECNFHPLQRRRAQPFCVAIVTTTTTTSINLSCAILSISAPSSLPSHHYSECVIVCSWMFCDMRFGVNDRMITALRKQTKKKQILYQTFWSSLEIYAKHPKWIVHPIKNTALK